MKAIALISGGLDSRLAAKLIQLQGISVIPLNFHIPFCHRNKKDSDLAQAIKGDLGVAPEIFYLKEEFLKILQKPRHGFGSNSNPCIDCKILMLAKAKEMMQKFGAEFIVTGEVLGQRPMSQHRKSLGIIAEESGLGGLLLRPLSARLLTPTIPEKMGWVRRDELCDFCGRTRRRQIELASVLGVRDYPNPSGGCLLTDAGFSQRVKDLIAKSELSLKNIELLKVGRHFRIAPHAKLVVGRNEEENRELENLAQEGDYLFFPAPEQAGATALGRGTFDQCFIYLACAITCRYFDLDDSQRAQILYKRIPEEGERTLSASPLSEKELQGLRI